MKIKIINALEIVIIISSGIGGYILGKKEHNNNQILNKDNRYMQLYNNWLLLNDNNISIKKYFEDNDIKDIAIYGYGHIGRHIVNQLLDSNIVIKYIIDKNRNQNTDILQYELNRELPKVDLIVVTPVLEFNEIKEEINKVYKGEVISIEDIIYDLL